MNLNAHPFNLVRTPAEILAYFQPAIEQLFGPPPLAFPLDPEKAWSENFIVMLPYSFLLSLATYFNDHPTNAPTCTIANIWEAITTTRRKPREQEILLAALGTYQDSAQLVQPMLKGMSVGAVKQLWGPIDSLATSLLPMIDEVQQAKSEVINFLLPRERPAHVATR